MNVNGATMIKLSHEQEKEDKPVPPRSPDRTPVKDPKKDDRPPMGDPRPPEKKKTRL